MRLAKGNKIHSRSRDHLYWISLNYFYKYLKKIQCPTHKENQECGGQDRETKQPILAFFLVWWGSCLCLSGHRFQGYLLQNVSWLNHGRKQNLVTLTCKSDRKKLIFTNAWGVLVRSTRQWKFQIKAVNGKRLWPLITISSVTWVTILLWSYQCCHCHNNHHNSPRHSSGKPQGKTCFIRLRDKDVYPRERWRGPKPRALYWISLQTRPLQQKIRSLVCQESFTKK